jgi:hypothetical protein
MLAERQRVFRRHLPEIHDVDSIRPWDGRVKVVAAARELTKSADNKTNSSVGLGPIFFAELLELGFNRPHFDTL